MHMIGVEIEISFHIVRDISPRSEPVGRDEALAAVGDACVGMEVVDTRLADFQQADPEWLLADNQMNHALVVGDSVKDWRSLDWPNLQVKLLIDSTPIVDQTGGLGAVDPATGNPATSFNLGKLGPSLSSNTTYYVSMQSVSNTGGKSAFSPPASFSF